MRKALIPAFLLVLGAVVLGSTVFREQLVNAATTPFQNVVVTNTNTNPIPVQQVGTSTTSVSGTVGIDPNNNTVKLDSTGNTVKLDSTDAANLASLGNLKFDSSGNLETTAQHPGPVAEHCFDVASPRWDVDNDGAIHTLCSEDFYATDITASGMDDEMQVDFWYDGSIVLSLDGSGSAGAASYQLDLTHPLHVDTITATCGNPITSCDFSLTVLGNSTGN